MPDDLDKRLAEAVTDEEARSAIFDAAMEIEPPTVQYASDILRLLAGPSAGWLGVGVLMLGDRVAIDGWGWQVSVEPLNKTSAHANVFGTLPWDNGERPSWGASAKRPDCALVIAARASTQGSER